MNKKLAAMARRALDKRTSPFSDAGMAPPPSGGWIRAIREALGMSATQFAARLGVARQTAQEHEQKEIDGSIGLSTLRRAAEALDCQLVYAFVPKTSLDEAVRAQARKVAMAELARVDQTMLLEGQRVEGSQAEERLAERVEELVSSRQLWNPIPRAES
ncbi:MAG TPA: mobile mystery protein A [Acidimicrobiales bacterium]|nr:mobile mystery protein A [Acidimicrobiales bacterium]